MSKKIAKIGKEIPYIPKVEKLIRKTLINFQNPELPKLVRNPYISKKSKSGKEIPYKFTKPGIDKIGKESHYIKKVEKW